MGKAYSIMKNVVDLEENGFYKQLWAVKAPSKVVALTWIIALNSVLTRENLRRRGISLANNDVTCVRKWKNLMRICFSHVISLLRYGNAAYICAILNLQCNHKFNYLYMIGQITSR